MTALSADAQRAFAASQETREYPLGAARKVYKGGFAGVDPGGYGKAFEPGDKLVGLYHGQADNSAGAAGALNARVITQGDVQFTLSGAALADVSKPVYATDDNTLALSGHPDAYVGRIVHYVTTNTVLVRLKAFGEKPPNGVGSVELVWKGAEAFDPTGADGATHGNVHVSGFTGKSILGLGILPTDAENGGVTLQFDAVAEIALASVRQANDLLPVDKGITFEVDLVVSDKGDDAALDIDFGFGTPLTTNSEASVDHGDMVQLACFHLNGNSDNVLFQSDDNTTDVAAVDTTIDNDSATDVAKKFKIVGRVDGTVEAWIAGARVLSTTSFALLSTALVAAFINAEKTSNDTTAVVTFKNLRVAGGCAA